MGVTFDRGLSWDKHTENLYKRLKCAIAVIKRIKPCITEKNFKTLYYTLFEFHLLYDISAWGGICHTRLEKGDLDKYMDKFCTYARTRPYENQVLTSEFYMKEHTKPIFNEKKILTIYNLYQYTSLCELAKILKYECCHRYLAAIIFRKEITET